MLKLLLIITRWQVYSFSRLIGKVVRFQRRGLTDETPLPKAAKPAWAKQLTRLLCLVVYVKSLLVYTTKSKMGRQLLLASTSSHVQL